LKHYRYADAMRELYDFAWDDFCSFYIEISKSRLNNPATKEHIKSVLVHVLSELIRLLHPVMPFVTEEIYQRLKEYTAACRLPSAVSIATAPFPVADEDMVNPEIEQQFAVFQELLRAVRDVRASRNVPPKTEIAFSVRCDEATAKLLKPMEPYFLSMAKAKATNWQTAESPQLRCGVVAIPLTNMDVFVDISDLIDVPAEIAKLEKEITKLEGFIKGKESKLASDFIQKAPPAVVEKERQSLAELQSQHQSATAALEQLKRTKK
jgi:valyl-tRNA synthetase